MYFYYMKFFYFYKEIDIGNKLPPLSLIKAIFQKKMCIVIDGYTLHYVFSDDEKLTDSFFRLSLYSNSCICCRVSPKQKADVKNLKYI